MASKLFILVLVLIGSECVFLQQSNENSIISVEKQLEDAEIQKILFGETTEIKECVKADATYNQKSTVTADQPFWTVVILQQEMFRNRTLNIQQCSGSLIHPKVVLTAAHCVYRKSLRNLKVRAGECKRIPQANSVYYQERRIESFELLSSYDPTNPHHDVALLFLKSPFRMTANVNTICLPPVGLQLDLDYVQCFVNGWERKPRILPGYENYRKVNMTLIPSERCETAIQLTGLGADFTLDESFMCAAGVRIKKDVLVANGGAPLVCTICEPVEQAIQIGVMSWGFENSPLPEVFTSLKKSHFWIRETLNERGLIMTGCGSRMTIMSTGLARPRL